MIARSASLVVRQPCWSMNRVGTTDERGECVDVVLVFDRPAMVYPVDHPDDLFAPLGVEAGSEELVHEQPGVDLPLLRVPFGLAGLHEQLGHARHREGPVERGGVAPLELEGEGMQHQIPVGGGELVPIDHDDDLLIDSSGCSLRLVWRSRWYS